MGGWVDGWMDGWGGYSGVVILLLKYSFIVLLDALLTVDHHHPVFTTHAQPHSIAQLDLKIPFNKDSSRVGPKEWVEIARMLDKYR